MVVSSKDNQHVKLFKQLSADGRIRRKHNLFVCEGARLCNDAAVSGIGIQTVLYTEQASVTYAAQLQPILQAAHTALLITPALAQHIGETTSPQGIFCICEMPQTRAALTALSANGRYLALEDVQDPANLGATVRTAEALGLDGLLLSAGCCDVYNPKVLRGSMGGVFRLPLFYVTDMTAAVADLRAGGFQTYACVPHADAQDIRETVLHNGCVCLIGNEGNGLKSQTIAACNARVTIPMDGRAESLNAAMAAGIVMWEMKRRGDA